jgi:non-canonical (house-cleaning) NTP pyrophosphatase
LKAGLAEIKVDPDDVVLGLGLEGGIIDNFWGASADLKNSPPEMWSTVWVVVIDQEGREFASNGARFHVPEKVAERIRRGEEMGTAAAILSGIENVKHKGGLIGVLTDNFTDRTEEYTAIVKMTVGLWYGRHWQKNVRSSII